MAGSPASRLECLMIWGGAEVILIGIKCPINAMRLNHPETILLPLVREIIVFHETCPGCQEGWGFLLWDEDYQFTRQTWTSLVFRCKDMCHWGTLLTARPTPCSLLGSGVSSVSAESLTTLCDPCDPCQASLSMTFPRQEYWSGLPFPSPGDLPDPGIEPVSCVPCSGRRILNHWTTREVPWIPFCKKNNKPCLICPCCGGNMTWCFWNPNKLT